MNLSDRIKIILQENKLKQKEFATEIGVTESYVSKLVNDVNMGLSKSLAEIIEMKYGYRVEWLLDGVEPKKKPIYNNIAQTLKALRIEKNLTQKQLAELTGISYASISSYELGRREPNSKSMVILEDFFGVTGTYLRGETVSNEDIDWGKEE